MKDLAVKMKVQLSFLLLMFGAFVLAQDHLDDFAFTKLGQFRNVHARQIWKDIID